MYVEVSYKAQFSTFYTIAEDPIAHTKHTNKLWLISKQNNGKILIMTESDYQLPLPFRSKIATISQPESYAATAR